jgi:hypothetical protein
MPADKPRPTLADYVTIVISPALIMAMIVSLVFFLVAVLYRGEFAVRLHHILFFLIFGMVLVARISMHAGMAERAPVYGGVLALLAWLSMGSFVSYPSEWAALSWLINAILIGLAWWLSHQLTHSCTYIDEQDDDTGAGLLLAGGFEQNSADIALTAPNDEEPPTKTSKRERKRAAQATWLERYQRFRAERKKNAPPGVWVIYFGLAALPIFGLGQALIDVADVERRTHTFWLMTLYLASALGLLVTTAFLGLRRYLRQRRLEMPKRVTVAWLILGAVLLVAFLLVGALLPRPQAEVSLLSIAGVGSKDVAASKYALTQGEPGKGAGRPGTQQQDPEGKPVDGKSPSRDGKGGNGQAKGQGSGAKEARQDANKDSNKQSDRDQRQQQNKQNSDGQSESAPEPARALPSLSQIATLLKWIVFGILAVVAVLFVLNGGLHYLANFCEWARRLLEALRRFWESLFGGWQRRTQPATDTDDLVKYEPPPFSSFANPFLDGRADKMAPAELVRYSFEALEAWAAGRGFGREAQETPLEFTSRLAEEVSFLDQETRQVGVLYARVLYAPGAVPAECRETLEDFWRRLESTSRRELVASD